LELILGRRRKKTKKSAMPIQIEKLPELEKSNKWFESLVLIILLTFSIYKAVKLFGAIPVPNPDYSGFLVTGKAILGFRLPPSFKRAPVLGMLIVTLSRFIGGAHPMLTAGWLLNAIFSCFNIIFVWQIGKKLIGKAAIWLAIVVIFNPLVMRYQVVPIAETSMIFFMLATFYFIFRHSNWAYLFAAIAAMTRYECVVLIFIAFVMDVVTRKTKKERIYAFCWAAIASIPFLLWMLGTYLNWNPKASHYIHHYKSSPNRTGFPKYFYLLWYNIYASMFQLPAYIKASLEGVTSKLQADAITDSLKSLHLYTKIFAVASCSLAVVYGIIKKNWYLISLLIFMFFYIIIHSMRVNSHARYTIPVIWMVMMISWYGVYVLYGFFDRPGTGFKIAQITFLSIVAIVSGYSFIRIVPFIPNVAAKSVKASTLPYAGFLVIALILLVYVISFKSKAIFRVLVLSLLTCFIITSQHFTTVRSIGNGGYNIEFKMLADWYEQNAQPGEKLACTWAHLLKLLADRHEDSFVDLKKFAGKTFEDFVDNCYKGDVKYIAWTARGSKSTRKGLENVGPAKIFQYQKDKPPFKFLKRIALGDGSKGHWIHIYGLQPRQNEPNEKTNTDNNL